MRQISPAGKEFVKKWEGLRLTAYLCPARVWTIGWGSTSMNGQPVKRGDKITKARAEELLDLQLGAVITSIYMLTPAAKLDKLSQPQFDALVSFVYNVGPGTYRYGSRAAAKSKRGTGSVYAAVMAGSPQAMALGLRKYVMADGKVSQGLKKRREEEAQMVLATAPVPAPPDVPAPEPVPIPPDLPAPPPAAPAGGWKGGLALAWGIILAIAGVIGWIFYGVSQ